MEATFFNVGPILQEPLAHKAPLLKFRRNHCVFQLYRLQIDNVGNPSWQAQITGTKEWTLEPPPECYHICQNTIKVTVYPGEVSKCFIELSLFF